MARNPEVIVPIAPVPAKVPGPDLPPAAKMILVAVNRLEKGINELARTVQDASHSVDEYSTESVTIDNVLALSVFPEYDKMAERVNSVIVTGPPSTAFTLNLGDRSWDVTTSAQGLFQVMGAGLLLGRNDVRALTVPPNPVPAQPAVPATTAAAQNANSYPVSVAVNANGATITAVTVNGIVVGAAAGTYVVPAYGAIAITYTVATPTWTWANANPAAAGNWTLELTGFADERYYAP